MNTWLGDKGQNISMQQGGFKGRRKRNKKKERKGNNNEEEGAFFLLSLCLASFSIKPNTGFSGTDRAEVSKNSRNTEVKFDRWDYLDMYVS